MAYQAALDDLDHRDQKETEDSQALRVAPVGLD